MVFKKNNTNLKLFVHNFSHFSNPNLRYKERKLFNKWPETLEKEQHFKTYKKKLTTFYF